MLAIVSLAILFRRFQAGRSKYDRTLSFLILASSSSMLLPPSTLRSSRSDHAPIHKIPGASLSAPLTPSTSR